MTIIWMSNIKEVRTYIHPYSYLLYVLGRSVPWSQRLPFNIIFFSFGNLRREALIKAPSREKKKASGRDR